MTQRYKLVIEYDGTPFCGWQSQRGGGAVQDVLNAAVKAFCGEDAVVAGAGRTDTGVHARGQVGHVDLEKPTDANTLAKALNAHLRADPVVVLSAEAVDDDFDARFSAIKRHYCYRVMARRARPAVDAGRVWWVPVPLDVEAMAAAAPLLTGQHDFTTFRSAQCQSASPVKTLDRLSVAPVLRDGATYIDVTACARSFLHHQVRSMVGALKAVGEGKWDAQDLQTALEARDRAACPPVAPPDGLYFMQVDYPEK